MTYFICAFKGEALSFIKNRKLQYDPNFCYPLYKNKNTLLVISGIGQHNASEATARLMEYRLPEKSDIIVNIGVCAAPERYQIGSVLIAKEIRYKKYILHTETAIDHPFKEIVLQSVDTVQNYPLGTPVDMEAFGIYSTASAYANSRQIFFIKIVSDHFKPKEVNLKEVIRLIELKTDEIESVLCQTFAKHKNKF